MVRVKDRISYTFSIWSLDITSVHVSRFVQERFLTSPIDSKPSRIERRSR